MGHDVITVPGALEIPAAIAIALDAAEAAGKPYDAVIALRDKHARIDGHEGYLEHEWASKTLVRLESIENATSPEHHATGKVLKDLVEHHIEEEENAVWTDVKQNFSADQRQQMNRAFQAAKARVRIH